MDPGGLIDLEGSQGDDSMHTSDEGAAQEFLCPTEASSQSGAGMARAAS
jgi:hypothetical protein